MKITRQWLAQNTPDQIPASPEELAAAQTFIRDQWISRSLEFSRPHPVDMTGACKFATLFVKLVFGGHIEGNWDHQWNIVDGQIIDLAADQKELQPIERFYRHDPRFFGNREHLESLQSCFERVMGWTIVYLRDVDIFQFMEGGCHALALELHKITNLPLVALLVDEAPAHVMVALKQNFSAPTVNDLIIDVHGVRTVRDVLPDADVSERETGRWDIVPVTPAKIRSWVNKGVLFPCNGRTLQRAKLLAERLVADPRVVLMEETDVIALPRRF